MYASRPPKPVPPTDTPSVGGALAATLVLLGLLFAAAYPLAALAVAATVLGARVLLRRLQTVVARSRDRVRELPLPGIGTLRFRIAPR